MKSDEQLRQHALDELRWDPAVDARHIDVSVEDRVVNLRGSVSSYAQKIAVEKAIQRMKDVKAFVVELAVQPPAPETHSRRRRPSTMIGSAPNSGLRAQVTTPASPAAPTWRWPCGTWAAPMRL